MSINVPYLSDEEIEAEADNVLKSFEKKFGKIQTIATPLDEIIETHLGLTFEIMDLGHPAILGQLNIKENLIRINSQLDPYQNARMEGRYNYTLAHEGGHSVLHRPYVEAAMEKSSLFGREKENIILCRTEERQELIEVQADRFASFLLMPRTKVIQQFQEYTGKPFVNMYLLAEALRYKREWMTSVFPDSTYVPAPDEILSYAFKELADRFRVSMRAMIIRLKILTLFREGHQIEMEYK